MPTALFDRAHGRSLAHTAHPPYQRAARQGLLRGAWNALAAIGERRAAADIARYVQERGGRPTGDLRKDVEQIVALRGLR
jgi:hypothetical protein